MRKYRIHTRLSDHHPDIPEYVVQVKSHFGIWLDIKCFFYPYEPEMAYRWAEELLELLQQDI